MKILKNLFEKWGIPFMALLFGYIIFSIFNAYHEPFENQLLIAIYVLAGQVIASGICTFVFRKDLKGDGWIVFGVLCFLFFLVDLVVNVFILGFCFFMDIIIINEYILFVILEAIPIGLCCIVSFKED